MAENRNIITFAREDVIKGLEIILDNKEFKLCDFENLFNTIQLTNHDHLVCLLDENTPQAEVVKIQQLSNPLQFIILGDAEVLLPLPSVFLRLPAQSTTITLAAAVRRAFEALYLKREKSNLNQQLSDRLRELKELNQIGIALSAERDLNKLLDVILEKSMQFTNSDAGSLYLVQEDNNQEAENLIFKHTRNNSLADIPFKEFVMPIDENSMAGYVALTGEPIKIADAYHLGKHYPFQFNRSFDSLYGYRTKSVLVLPMKNKKGETVGVLQLLNRKRRVDTVLKDPQDFAQHVIEFDDNQVDSVSSLASQAAIAIENNLLTLSIENLFESFVHAAMLAIEQRDPPTSGHSARVAAMTCALAEEVNRLNKGPYAQAFFDSGQIKELRYASLLHDFGKIGVREEVLTKAKKLYPADIQIIEKRFDFALRTLETLYKDKKLESLLNKTPEISQPDFSHLEEEFRQEQEKLLNYLKIVQEANEPTILPDGSFEALKEIEQFSLPGFDGSEQHLLTSQEVEYLSIRKGTLTPKEFAEIEAHVVNTYDFLKNIPWTKECSHVPEYALAHHEKLDGSGYQKMKAEDIPLQTRMMAVCDTFDALTASDRPYKKAVPRDKALQILGFMVKDGHLDGELVRVFQEKEVYLAGEKATPGK